MFSLDFVLITSLQQLINEQTWKKLISVNVILNHLVHLR